VLVIPDEGSIEAIPVTPERHLKIKELVFAASEKSGDERARFLSEACGDDPGLRDEVERLLDDALPDTADLQMPIGQGVAEIRQHGRPARAESGGGAIPPVRSRRRRLIVMLVGVVVLAGAAGIHRLRAESGGPVESPEIGPQTERAPAARPPESRRPVTALGPALNRLSEILIDLGDVERAEQALRASLNAGSRPADPLRTEVKALVDDVRKRVADRPELKERDRVRLRRTLDEVLLALEGSGRK